MKRDGREIVEQVYASREAHKDTNMEILQAAEDLEQQANHSQLNKSGCSTAHRREQGDISSPEKSSLS
jgi:hypothetical protein